MIRRKTKSSSIRGEKIYRDLKQIFKKQIKSNQLGEMPTDVRFIQAVIEDCNKLIADKFIKDTEIYIPYIGRLVVVNKKRNISSGRINLPISGTLSKQYNKKIFIDLPKLIDIKFEGFRKQYPYNRLMGFRLNRELFNKVKNYVLDYNIPLYSVKEYDTSK